MEPTSTFDTRKSQLYTAYLMSDLAAIAYCANIILHSGRLSRPMRAGPDGGRWMGQDAPLEGAPSPCCPLPFWGWGASTMRATISISARPGLLARCLVCVHHVEPYCFITIKAAPILFPLFIFTSALVWFSDKMCSILHLMDLVSHIIWALS